MSATRNFERRSGEPRRPFVHAREGAVGVATAFSVAFMVGAVALAVDLGQAYNLSTTLDNAADAYAIAGATQLDRTSDSCLRAIRAATNATLLNEETFASNTSGVVTIDSLEGLGNGNIRFLRNLDKDPVSGNFLEASYIAADAALADCDSDAEYIEVTVDSDAGGNPYRVDFALAPILGITEAFTSGYAVAGLGQAFCGVAPMMMCGLESLPGGAADFWDDLNANPEVYRGRGLWLQDGKRTTPWEPGNFGFLRVEGECDDACLELAFSVNPPVCLPLEGLKTETAAASRARDGFNSIFDIYPGGGGVGSDDPQWQPSVNTVKGGILTDGIGNCKFERWDFLDPPYTGPFDPPPVAAVAMPYPMDTCAYDLPHGTGTCLGTDGTNRMGTGPLVPGYWDIDTYLEVNQDDMTEFELRIDPSFLAANPGLGLLDHITRLMVYEWEMGYPGTDWGSLGFATPHLVDQDDLSGSTTAPYPNPLGLGPPFLNPQTAEYGGPQCYSGPMGDDQATNTTLLSDRRVLQIAVVDCGAQAIQGDTTEVKAEGLVEVLALTTWNQPAEGVNQMYVEIIGPVQSGMTIVQLYE